MNADLDLPALKKLCDAATPGPWWGDSEHARFVRSKSTTYVVSKSSEQWNPVDKADIEFIAAARTAVPQLIEFLEERSKIICGQEMEYRKLEEENLTLRKLLTETRGHLMPDRISHPNKERDLKQRIDTALGDKDL